MPFMEILIPITIFLLLLFCFKTRSFYELKFRLATFWLLIVASPGIALAEIVKIEFTNFDTYSLEIVRINVGDTVEWLPTSEGHNVEFIVTPSMTTFPKKSKMNEFHSQIFQKPGIYVYGCTPHLNMGMLGLIVVGDDFHNIPDTEEINLSPVAKSVLTRLITKARFQSETR